MRRTSEIYEIIHATASAEGNKIPVNTLCDIAGVSRPGYYAWVAAADEREERELRDREDFELILKAYKMRGYSKGAKGIKMALEHMNPPVVMNLKKIHRLMNKYGLICPTRRHNPHKIMAQALKESYVAGNILNREFESYGPRVVLLTDVTYLRYNGKYAYLSTVIDAYTKQILAYVVSDSLEEDFILETINQLIEKEGDLLTAETIIHSDQGPQYTSRQFSDLLRSKSLRQSMSRRKNCWDNAPQESFFGHLKDSVKDKLALCRTLDDVKKVIDDYIDYYNNDRYQWDLAKLSPNEYYEFCVTGEYPLDVPDRPSRPTPEKEPPKASESLPGDGTEEDR